jgi:hypothetical protein
LQAILHPDDDGIDLSSLDVAEQSKVFLAGLSGYFEAGASLSTYSSTGAASLAAPPLPQRRGAALRRAEKWMAPSTWVLELGE